MEIKVKILREGDEVLNVWPQNSGYCIAVRRRNSEVYVYFVNLDENKLPRIEETHPLIITFGNKEVEATMGDESLKKQKILSPDQITKITTF